MCKRQRYIVAKHGFCVSAGSSMVHVDNHAYKNIPAIALAQNIIVAA